jgi:hypothetical protein
MQFSACLIHIISIFSNVRSSGSEIWDPDLTPCRIMETLLTYQTLLDREISKVTNFLLEGLMQEFLGSTVRGCLAWKKIVKHLNLLYRIFGAVVYFFRVLICNFETPQNTSRHGVVSYLPALPLVNEKKSIRFFFVGPSRLPAPVPIAPLAGGLPSPPNGGAALLLPVAPTGRKCSRTPRHLISAPSPRRMTCLPSKKKLCASIPAYGPMKEGALVEPPAVVHHLEEPHCRRAACSSSIPSSSLQPSPATCGRL